MNLFNARRSFIKVAALFIVGAMPLASLSAQTIPFTFTGNGTGGSLVISWSSSISYTIGTTPNTGNNYPAFVIQGAGDLFGTTSVTPTITSTATFSRTSPTSNGPFTLNTIETHFAGTNTGLTDILLFQPGQSVGNNMAIGDVFVLSAGSVTLASFTGTVPTSGSYSTFLADQNGKNLGAGALSAVPEPSTYAAIAGAACLGFSGWRRRRRVASVSPVDTVSAANVTA